MNVKRTVKCVHHSPRPSVLTKQAGFLLIAKFAQMESAILVEDVRDAI
jgi:hypothetical protein